MKTKEELNAIKEEVEILNKKLAELTEEELEQVRGGAHGCTPATKIEDLDFPLCYAPQENLNVAKAQDCTDCKYYERCHNPDKA